jgi:chloride channel protein, CIC family
VLEAAQLVHVEGRELTEARLTLGAEGEAHDSVIVRVDRTRDEPGPLGAADQFDDAVVAQQQMVGDVSDRRRAVVSPDGQQQLVLGGRKADGPGLPLRPTFEPTERVAEGEELPEIRVAQRVVGTHIVPRYSTIRGHGIPEAMEAVLTKQSRVSPRTAIAKPLSAAVAIGSGGPFGAEGPIIVTGGALGSLLGQVLHVSPSERKVLLASGAAAGMAATLGAPLAAVVLAIELLLFEFSTRAFVPLVVATSVAGAVHAAAFGFGPLFTVPHHDFAGLAQLPWFAGLGVFCGLLATVIAKGLFVVERAYRRLPVDDRWHLMLGALVWASLGLLVPRALGVGYDVIDDALAGRPAVGTLAALAVGKLVIWWVALASGTSGGTLAPILLISSCAGGLVGHAVHALAPGVGVSPTTFALVAMAATFGAATRARSRRSCSCSS